MGEFASGELDNLVDYATEDVRRRDVLEQTVNRYEQFLLANGEVLGLDAWALAPWYEDKSLRSQAFDMAIHDKECELRRPMTYFELNELDNKLESEIELERIGLKEEALKLEQKRVIIVALAKQSLFFDERWNVTGERPASDIKKRLQAQLLVGEFGGAWLELVGAEYPGDWLKPEDQTIIEEEVQRLTESSTQINLETEQKVQELTIFMTERGRVLLSARETARLMRYVADAVCATPEERVLQLEDEVLALSDEGLLDADWAALVRYVYARDEL